MDYSTNLAMTIFLFGTLSCSKFLVDKFGVYALTVSHMQKLGMIDRAAAKAGSVLENDKNWQ